MLARDAMTPPSSSSNRGDDSAVHPAQKLKEQQIWPPSAMASQRHSWKAGWQIIDNNQWHCPAPYLNSVLRKCSCTKEADGACFNNEACSNFRNHRECPPDCALGTACRNQQVQDRAWEQHEHSFSVRFVQGKGFFLPVDNTILGRLCCHTLERYTTRVRGWTKNAATSTNFPSLCHGGTVSQARR